MIVRYQNLIFIFLNQTVTYVVGTQKNRLDETVLVLKITVSMRWFFWAPIHYAKADG